MEPSFTHRGGRSASALRLLLPITSLLLVACAPEHDCPTDPGCRCVGDIPTGRLDVACGELACVGGVGYRCTAMNTAIEDPLGCMPSVDGGAPDGPYSAYLEAYGPTCGANFDGAPVRCRPRDTCTSESEGRCETNADGTYQAYAAATGGWCGRDNGPWASCQPGDLCLDRESSVCITSPDGRYEGSINGAGEYCGSPQGLVVRCEPGDECEDELDGMCRPSDG